MKGLDLCSPIWKSRSCLQLLLWHWLFPPTTGAPRLPQRLLLTCRPQSGCGGPETGTMSVLRVVECAGLAAATLQNTFQEAIKTSVISLILMSIASLLKASRRVRLPLPLPPHPRVVPASLPLLVFSLSPTSGLSLSSV